MSKYRHIVFYCVANQMQHRFDPRQLIVYTHRATHQNQPGVAVNNRRDRVSCVHVDMGLGNATRSQKIAQVARAFGLGEAENDNGFHQQGKSEMKVQAYCIAVIGLMGVVGLCEATSVGIIGLFKDKAIVSVDGSPPKTLSLGQSLGGARLISATSESALIEVDGKRRTLTMGQSFASAANSDQKPAVMLSADPSGHFITQGAINGVPILFLVDTGATSVAIGAHDAKRMNLDLEHSPAVLVGTAAGLQKAWKVSFNTVKVGSITLNQVEGFVVEANINPALLGMSFLNRTDMKREGQTMTLVRRY
jgi:aspartyl protease family protein